MDCQSRLRAMKRYCSKAVEAGQVGVNYKFAKNCGEGRLYADGNSLQLIKREFRGLLCDGLYYDFDMVNASPSILNYLCKANGVTIKRKMKTETSAGTFTQTTKLSALNDYCQDRDAKLMKLCEEDNMTKSEAKLLFIKSLNTEYRVTKHN